MLIVKVTKYSKNGTKREYSMKFKGTNEELLEVERLADLAEDCYVDQSNGWK